MDNPIILKVGTCEPDGKGGLIISGWEADFNGRHMVIGKYMFDGGKFFGMTLKEFQDFSHACKAVEAMRTERITPEEIQAILRRVTGVHIQEQ